MAGSFQDMIDAINIMTSKTREATEKLKRDRESLEKDKTILLPKSKWFGDENDKWNCNWDNIVNDPIATGYMKSDINKEIKTYVF